jgi:CRP-like cAMP-binding protein
MVLGEAEAGSIVGLEALLSQDQLGIGVVAATDVLALEVESDTLLGILGDRFPLVHDAIQVATRRLLALTRRLGPRDEWSGLLFRPRAGRPMNLVELLLLFEDNVDIALDYLAWVNRTTLELIEAAMGPGRELLEFFATFSARRGLTAAIPRQGRG